MISTTINEDLNLTTNEAIVLQQVHEDGEDDIRSLSYELGMSRREIINNALRLEQKGLLDLHQSFDGLLLHVSQRGKTIIKQIWPNAQTLFA